MACGCGDDRIYKEEISSSNNINNDLTAIIIQGSSPAECSDEWLSSKLIEGRNLSTKNTIPTKHKIQKVSQLLREMDHSGKKCYYPQVISIGPYHHGKEELNAMEKLKSRFMWEYVNSCNGTSADSMYKRIAELAKEARKCYAEDDSTIRFNDMEFARMMFVDGCFLLQFIFCMAEGKAEELKLKIHDIAYIQKDLFLLENQLPFMVLKALMKFSLCKKQGLQKIKDFIQKSRGVPPPRESFREKLENFIANPKCRRRSHGGGAADQYKDDPAHLLELVRREIIDPNAFNVQYPGDKKKGQNNPNFWYSYRSVQELKTAGIIFRPNRFKHNLLTDVRYESLFVRAVLRLPVMTIHDSTKSLLLNLVAYEMCPDTPNDFGVTSYLWLMDTLIDHADDVKELRQRGILLNVLASDEEVAKLFNEIADNLVPNPNAYANVKSQIEKHYKSKFNL